MSEKRETNEVTFTLGPCFFSGITFKITVQEGGCPGGLAELKRQKTNCREAEETKICGSEY